MGGVLTIAKKDLRLLVRDRVGLFWALVFPLVYAVFFGLFMGGKGDVGGGVSVQSKIRIALVDLDGSPESRAFVNRLNSSDALDIRETVEVDGAAAPMTRELAHDRVRLGTLTAYVIVPAGYADSATPWSGGDPPEIEIGVDPSRQAESGMLQGLVMEAAFRGIEDLFTNPATIACT